MPYLLDLVYLLALTVLWPWLLIKKARGKFRQGLRGKFFSWSAGQAELPREGKPVVWFHGVSVGEIHLLGPVVRAFRASHPDWQCVISSTTDTGFDEARRRFEDLPVIYWPFDFTWTVRRALEVVRPRLVVLAEGETWPNFLRCARQRGVAVALVNGRMSPGSFGRYRRLRWLLGSHFRRLDLCAVQTGEFADWFARLGARQVVVTGSVKYDGACVDRANARTQALGRLLGLGEHELVLVAGSTQAPEEDYILQAWAAARQQQPNLRLLLVPRQKERFDEVARLLQRRGIVFQRRSALREPPIKTPPVILIDTIGELGALWGLADLAFVGGSLDGKRGGQNMIEPAAYGTAVLFGPHVWNFRETARRLLEEQAAVQVADAAALQQEMLRLLDDQGARAALGAAAQRFVLSQQGATERTVQALARLLAEPVTHSRAA